MNELDLHNVRHPDVDMIVENYVLMNKTPMNIIIGQRTVMSVPWNFIRIKCLQLRI